MNERRKNKFKTLKFCLPPFWKKKSKFNARKLNKKPLFFKKKKKKKESTIWTFVNQILIQFYNGFKR